MKWSQRTRIGLLCLIPIVGILLAATLPPFDEYASLDRIGDRVTTPPRTEPYDVDPFQRVGVTTDVQTLYPRRWKIRGSEIEADHFIKNFATKSRGWQVYGANLFGNLPKRKDVNEESPMYTNGETGDRLLVERNLPLAGNGNTPTYYIAVIPPPTPKGFWPKLKRWVHLIFSKS